MLTTRSHPLILLAGLFAVVGGPWLNPALANPLTAKATSAGWFTDRKISGNVGAANAGAVITVTYATKPPTVQTAIANANGDWEVFPPKNVPIGTATTITSDIAGCKGPAGGPLVAQLLTPPGNSAVCSHAVLP